MKKIILFALCIPLFTTAQKVKVKKGTVYIDKIEVGSQEKKKNDFNHNTYTYKDKSGKTLLIFNYEAIPSLLEGKDEAYYFTSLTIPDVDKKIFYDTKGYNIIKSTFIKYFLKNGLINTDGSINQDKAKELATSPELPEQIKANLEKEKQQKQNQDFILERDKILPFSVVFVKSQQKDMKHLRAPGLRSFVFDTFRLEQDGKVIGKVVARYNAAVDLNASTKGLQKQGDPEVFFFNSKGGRIAYINSFPTIFRVHNGNEEYDRHKQSFLTEKLTVKKIRLAIEWLIANNKL